MTTLEKMTPAAQATTRSTLYEIVLNALFEAGYETEIAAKGALIKLPSGHLAKIQISVCDPTKTTLETEREKYQEKVERQAAIAEKKLAAAEEKARKAAEKAAKKAEKEAATAE